MMKRSVLFCLNVLGLIALLGMTIPALFAGSVYEYRGLDFTDGHIANAPTGAVLFASKFDSADQWEKPKNYQNRLKITMGKEFKGQKCLVVSGEDIDKIDTAWNIASKPVKLTKKGDQFALAFEVCSTVEALRGVRVNAGSWRSTVLWFNAKNELCGDTGFSFNISKGYFNETIVYGDIPAEAVAFSIQFGFDSPNVDQGNAVVFRSVDFSLIDSKQQYTKPGCFVSEIFPGGEVSWTADIPQGTQIQFQAATADSVNGEPGRLSKFVGPDGTDSSYYTKPFKVDAAFMRYKCILTPAVNVRPVVTSVTVGDRCENRWTDRADNFPPRVKIISKTPTLDKRTNVVLQITDDAPVMWKSLKITVDGKEATKKFVRKGNQLTLTPTSDWADGLHQVNVDVTDYRENVVKAKKYFFIGQSPKTPKVTMRDDGMTLIDGKPFFPIGLYSVMKREFNDFDIDKAFKGLKEAGFNFAHSYTMMRSEEFLAAALKYDFKLWATAHVPDKWFIEIGRHHPAIIAWYLGDDTSANTTPSELYDRDDAVKAIDPTRISTQADGVAALSTVSNYQDYVHGTDNFLPEIYPVHTLETEKNNRCVARVVFDMERCRSDIALADAPVKSLWPIIQYFKGWGWQRFPTMQELRGMSFASLVHGAHGITWYTYGGTVDAKRKKFNYGVTTTPETWNNISTVATQIKTLSPALMERTPKDQPKVEIVSGPKKDYYDNPSVTCLLKKHDGYTYVIAVNASHEPVEAAFVTPGTGSVEVLFEDRNVAFANGRIRDAFKGQDVHVYKWKD